MWWPSLADTQTRPDFQLCFILRRQWISIPKIHLLVHLQSAGYVERGNKDREAPPKTVLSFRSGGQSVSEMPGLGASLLIVSSL